MLESLPMPAPRSRRMLSSPVTQSRRCYRVAPGAESRRRTRAGEEGRAEARTRARHVKPPTNGRSQGFDFIVLIVGCIIVGAILAFFALCCAPPASLTLPILTLILLGMAWFLIVRFNGAEAQPEARDNMESSESSHDHRADKTRLARIIAFATAGGFLDHDAFSWRCFVSSAGRAYGRYACRSEYECTTSDSRSGNR
jgi:F0F1-type ATP synthase assembly protein I